MICYLYPQPTYFFFAEGLPALLYYSHIPASVVALLVGVFLFLNGKGFLLNRLLLAIALCFSAWTVLNLIAWTNINSPLLLFVSSFFGLLSALISVLSVYFIYVFLEGKDVSLTVKMVFLAILLPVFAFAFAGYGLNSFDITECNAFGSDQLPIEMYYASVGVVGILWILALLIRKYRNAASDVRKQILLIGTGIEFFLVSFFAADYLAVFLTTAGITESSAIEMYGLFGMIVFMVYIAIVTVRFKTFHVGLIATQALVVALIILIGSQFTYVSNLVQQLLTAVTLVLTAVVGIVLIRSVKREVEQRKRIEALAKDLEKANNQQVTLIHFITHQLKGFVSKSRNIFSMIQEGDFGVVPEPMVPVVHEGFCSSTKGAETIQEILNAANIKNGKIAYSKEEIDISALVQGIVTTLKPNADAKNVALTVTSPKEPIMLSLDRMQMENAIKNLVDNSIKYTLSGSITIAIEKDDKTVKLTLTDTGVGITPEDMEHLFTEGGRGKESQKVNVDSTGFGLYIVKNIIEAHGGHVWAESEGHGKGSRFIVELPVATEK